MQEYQRHPSSSAYLKIEYDQIVGQYTKNAVSDTIDYMKYLESLLDNKHDKKTTIITDSDSSEYDGCETQRGCANCHKKDYCDL